MDEIERETRRHHAAQQRYRTDEEMFRPRRNTGRPRTRQQSHSAGDLESLFLAGVWFIAWLTASLLLAAPATILSMAQTYPGSPTVTADQLVLAFCSPIVALLVSWRTDRWRRPIGWTRLLIVAVVLLALSSAIGYWVGAATASNTPADPASTAEDFWVVTQLALVLAAFTLLPVVLVFSFIARRFRANAR